MSSNLNALKSVSGLNIGQVLELLANEFTGLTPSKLRFLEEQGLIEPNRTKSGYRKFSLHHVERLRLILTLQREHYLPLKVIAEFLAELDAGLDPAIPGERGAPASSILAPRVLLDRAELIRRSGASAQLLNDAIRSGILPQRDVFSEEEAREFDAIAHLAKMGVTSQHLRTLRASCERDAQLITHAARARTAHADSLNAQEESRQLTALLSTVREGMLRRVVQSYSG